MTVAATVAAGFACVVLLVGVGLAVAGVLVLRRNARSATTRLRLEAVVVHRTSHVRPSRVTFDHPVPGGWARATRVEGLPVTGPDGRVAGPGDRIVVWADPRNPSDVRLTGGSAASSVGGVLLLLMATGCVGLALWFVTMAFLAPR